MGFPQRRKRRAAVVRPSRSPAGRLTVLLERIPSSREAQSLVTTLREQGFGEATLVSPEPPIVRAAEPAPLRTAVEIAEKLRASGPDTAINGRGTGEKNHDSQDDPTSHDTPPGKNTRCTNQNAPAAITTTEPANAR